MSAAVRGVVSGVLVLGIGACSGDEQKEEAQQVELPAGVTLAFVDGNPSCADLGYAYEGKLDSPSAGTTTIDLPGGETATFTIPGSLKGVTSWSSSIALDAVIVKAGNGANVYTYNPEATSGGPLESPDNDGGNVAQISHLSFCFDFELAVTKTAQTSFTRDHEWSILKTASHAELLLSLGQVFNVGYTVALTRTYSDSDFAVGGTITVHNPDPGNSATVTGVTDSFGGNDLPVTCEGVTFPHSLAPGASLSCTYSASLDAATEGVNTATATVAEGSPVGGGSGTANVDFDAPTTSYDDCVDVTDTLAGPLGQICGTHTFSYSLPFSYNTCGEYTVPNTASFETADGDTGSSSASVSVDVPCVDGCTLTQGYWKTHSAAGPAPYDDTWAQLPQGHNTPFFGGELTYLQVLKTPPGGNAYFVLAHQYIAAQLNGLNGADFTAASAAFAEATTLFQTYTWAQIGKLKGQNPLRNQFIALAGILDEYNNGLVGPGHCSE